MLRAAVRHNPRSALVVPLHRQPPASGCPAAVTGCHSAEGPLLAVLVAWPASIPPSTPAAALRALALTLAGSLRRMPLSLRRMPLSLRTLPLGTLCLGTLSLRRTLVLLVLLIMLGATLPCRIAIGGWALLAVAIAVAAAITVAAVAVAATITVAAVAVATAAVADRGHGRGPNGGRDRRDRDDGRHGRHGRHDARRAPDRYAPAREGDRAAAGVVGRRRRRSWAPRAPPRRCRIGTPTGA